MEKQLEYLLKNFSLFYNIEKYTVGYNSKATDVSIFQGVQASFWTERKDIKITDVVWKKWKGTNIPFLFVRDISEEIISFVDGRAIINYDIVASTFYFLSGWNELVSSNEDNFGRVKYKDSIIKALNISGIPVVNYYFDILRDAIETIAEKDIKINRWEENKFAVSLTHDIDTCKSAWIEGSFSELKKKRFLSIPKLIIKRLFNKDDWFNFNTIIDIEREFNTSSTYYFLPRKEKDGNWKNADYNIKSKSLQNIISFLKTSQMKLGYTAALVHMLI